MKATAEDRARLERALDDILAQIVGMGAKKVVLFGSLARGETSLFSDIDLLAVFDDDGRTPHEVTRDVYRRLNASETVDVLAYGRAAFEELRSRPFLRHVLSYGKVLYEEP
jgi:predicted nucleotidyltransferase